MYDLVHDVLNSILLTHDKELYDILLPLSAEHRSPSLQETERHCSVADLRFAQFMKVPPRKPRPEGRGGIGGILLSKKNSLWPIITPVI